MERLPYPLLLAARYFLLVPGALCLGLIAWSAFTPGLFESPQFFIWFSVGQIGYYLGMWWAQNARKEMVRRKLAAIHGSAPD